MRERGVRVRCNCGTQIEGDSDRCSECTRQMYEEVWSHRVSNEFSAWKSLLYGSILLVISCIPAYASPEINPEKLCDAIYKAEGGAKTKHPYGILQKYKTTTPRQACINTVKSAQKRYKKDDKGLDFIPFLGSTYCPVGAKNDPTGLNKNWVGNVERFYGIS